MRILIDTNVLLDAFFNRAPWDKDAALVWERCEQGVDIGYIPTSILTDIYYIARRKSNRADALKYVEVCFDSLELCSVDSAIIGNAIVLPNKDFEDNIFIACATTYELDAIITRNLKDFKHSPIDVCTPSEWLTKNKPDSEGEEDQ